MDAMPDTMPVVRDPSAFDRHSGHWLERIVFNHRAWVIALCALVSLLLGWQASKLQVNASFEKMIPQSHPYIKNYLANRKDLAGINNAVRVVVENTRGDIFDANYLVTLQKVNDALFLPQTRERFQALLNLGLTDAIRAVSDAPGHYTFWDYQAGAWQKNNGIRIDHLLLSPQAADRLAGAGIDKHVRSWEKPSDHVPVWVELELEPRAA